MKYSVYAEIKVLGVMEDYICQLQKTIHNKERRLNDYEMELFNDSLDALKKLKMKLHDLNDHIEEI